MKSLRVIAPAERVKALRELAKEQCMSIYQDGKYLKLKWGVCQPVLDQAQATLPEGSFEIYASAVGLRKSAGRAGRIDAVRIRIK